MNISTPCPQILFESPRWLVLNKPAGWLTIPGRSRDSGVLSEWAGAAKGPVWTVHRLDLETSGVVLFARTSGHHQQASLWFQQRKVKKVYHCLASGIPELPLLKIKEPVRGSPSVTQVEILESYREGFLARVCPGTGRRHQIRIHLSKQGYPIWGDELYGGIKEIILPSETLTISRVALHASSLELPTGERFEALFSEDFAGWLTRLRAGGRRV